MSTLQVDLTSLNTLQVSAKAENLIEVNSLSDISNFDFQNPHLFLGSGANILFTKDFPGTILKINLLGKKILSESSSEVHIEIGAGESWHELVKWTVDSGWYGIENMALIPGTVGAAIVGNIAAYGQNVMDTFVSASGIHLPSKSPQTFSFSDCEFTYRSSIFKTKLDQKFLISSVVLKLSKTPKLETSYTATHHASLLPTLQKIATPPYTNRDVFDAVVKLRTEKLPDWHTFPNAGSFFKNPLISQSHYQKIKELIPDLQAYPPEKLIQSPTQAITDQVKVPAGHLLDHLGWKGKKIGNVGTHPNHALVIINYGATGKEIYEFSEQMRTDIKNKFDIDLEYEVKII